MSTPFQNRLVGTIIVAAVIVIFLPDLLDGNKKSYQAQFEEIPAQDKTFSQQKLKVFPQEKLNKLPKETLVNESAVDAIKQSDESDNTRVKVTPVKKNNSIKSKPEKTKIQQAKSKPSTNKKVLPEKTIAQQAWAIQLGSFKHKNNVNELTAKLKTAGYTVFTRPIKTANGVLTKVFIGPELIKSTLDKQLPALKKLTNVQGKVARFYPTK